MHTHIYVHAINIYVLFLRRPYLILIFVPRMVLEEQNLKYVFSKMVLGFLELAL